MAGPGEAASATEVKRGQSTGLGIESAPSFRDPGGYKTSDGASVSAGLVYRAKQLSGVSREDMEKIAALTLRNAYDLRTAEEKSRRPDVLPPRVNCVWLDALTDPPQAGPAQRGKPMADPKTADPEVGGGKEEARFKASYREFVSLPSAQREFSKLFLALGDKEQLRRAFHCTTGKDRTWWTAAALLSLPGVRGETVIEDYIRRNDSIIRACKNTSMPCGSRRRPGGSRGHPGRQEGVSGFRL